MWWLELLFLFCGGNKYHLGSYTKHAGILAIMYYYIHDVNRPFVLHPYTWLWTTSLNAIIAFSGMQSQFSGLFGPSFPSLESLRSLGGEQTKKEKLKCYAKLFFLSQMRWIVFSRRRYCLAWSLEKGRAGEEKCCKRQLESPINQAENALLVIARSN